jgi:hypothetical protein
MRHFYPRGAFYLACMAAGAVLMLLASGLEQHRMQNA